MIQCTKTTTANAKRRFFGMNAVNNMLNFTVGPVMSCDEVRNIGFEQVPYFRTEEFSKIVKENESYIKNLLNAEKDSKVVFITGSGTASMEAAVVNCFSKDDRLLIVNGGSFGQRFVDIANTYEIPNDEIRLNFGKNITSSDLAPFDNKEYSGLLVNIHETSSGVLYDLNLISEFCKRNKILLVVDAVSSFLADPIDMQKSGIDILLTASQKALACPPGISLIVLKQSVIERININKTKCFYLNLKSALENSCRGQTPFTPAVSIIIQINARLKQIIQNGGVEFEINKVREIAEDFRNRIKTLPFEIASNSLSNAVTPLYTKTASAHKIFQILKDEYKIWICPNGGQYADQMFRVGHIGNLSISDNLKLVDAFLALQQRKII